MHDDRSVQLTDFIGEGPATYPAWTAETEIRLMPRDAHLQSKAVPVDMYVKKLTSAREKLRVLEQRINNSKSLPVHERLTIQSRITETYLAITRAMQFIQQSDTTSS